MFVAPIHVAPPYVLVKPTDIASHPHKPTLPKKPKLPGIGHRPKVPLPIRFVNVNPVTHPDPHRRYSFPHCIVNQAESNKINHHHPKPGKTSLNHEEMELTASSSYRWNNDSCFYKLFDPHTGKTLFYIWEHQPEGGQINYSLYGSDHNGHPTNFPLPYQPGVWPKPVPKSPTVIAK